MTCIFPDPTLATDSPERRARRRSSWAILLVVAGCLFVSACAAEPEVEPRINVLLITLDTTRADRLGCYGNRRIATPNLDRLAAEGVLFEAAFTPVPSTLPSHCSIMTAMYPARHGVHDNGIYRLDDSFVTLAERLNDEGYRTGAFVSAFVLDRQFGLAQGFDTYDDRVDEPQIDADPGQLLLDDESPDEHRRWLAQLASPFERRADAVSRGAIDWLRQSSQEPFFLWVHYFDPHTRYDAPEPWTTRYDPDYTGPMDGSPETFERIFIENGWDTVADVPRADLDHMVARYDGEIAFMDSWIGKLPDALEETGHLGNTLIVVVGDHGESFGEHGQIWEHNSHVFDEVIRVPFIIRPPGGLPDGRRIPGLVRTLDVAPTILGLAGAAPLDGIDGESLHPMIEDEPGEIPERHILLQALRERQVFASDHSWLGLRSSRYKLILKYHSGETNPERVLLDLGRDPGEMTPLSPAPLAMIESWTHRTVTSDRTMRTEAGQRAWRGLDEVTSDALRALGYIE
jgi:arylsulfatase A-like enzyme